ncbi:toxin HicA [Corynebacterium sp. YIM 101645]|uniref:Toxin HicA n=1 Tax=Corynebacterium lemuris TaxID=1859292 RepID=A0ABT2FS41_9CORY|nr:toxin HicA [Corynebacterium lemuris]MCS5478035.1 toxin HicA [Corynebacterium lemuris]
MNNFYEKWGDSPANIRFVDLEKVCDHFFEKRPSKKTSHQTCKTPWMGDPRVNIQNDRGKAKPCQVQQVLQAVEKLKSHQH